MFVSFRHSRSCLRVRVFDPFRVSSTFVCSVQAPHRLTLVCSGSCLRPVPGLIHSLIALRSHKLARPGGAHTLTLRVLGASASSTRCSPTSPREIGRKNINSILISPKTHHTSPLLRLWGCGGLSEDNVKMNR